MPNSIPIIFDSQTAQIVTGSLLSDGTIGRPHKRCQNYYFSHSSASEQYVDFLKSQICFHLNKNAYQASINQAKGKIKHSIRGTGGYTIRSRTSPVFTNLRNEWYPNDKKSVPKTIELTPIVVLHWYLGDGTLDNERGVEFCTEGFDADSIEYLREKLTNIVEVDVTKRNRLLVPNRSVFEFFEYVGHSAPFEDYAHKWDTIVKEAYSGRKCKGCGISFDTKLNSRYFCSHTCYIRHWRKNGPTLRVTS